MFLPGNLMLKMRHLSDVCQASYKVDLSHRTWVLLGPDWVSKPEKWENRKQEGKIWNDLVGFSAKLPRSSDLLLYLNF